MTVDFQRDIYELNLQYLMVLQKVALHDEAEAAMRFGIDIKTADAVRNASIRELQSLASSVVAMMSARPLLQELSARAQPDRLDRARAGAILRSISVSEPVCFADAGYPGSIIGAQTAGASTRGNKGAN